jgi:RNA polymerase I-specific transcription initiation factor RRN3
MRSFSSATRTPVGPPPRTATPVKSILKTQTVLGRRKADDAGLDDATDALESPTKRRKVFFNEVQNKVYEVGNRTMEEIKFEVRTALEEHRRGNDGPYDTLKEMFSKDKTRYASPSDGDEEDTPKPHELRSYVVALTSCMPLLKEKECNGLVRAILKFPWLGRDEEFLKVFTHFLAALISAQGSYLLPVLSMMVDQFTATRPSSWLVADFPAVSRDAMRDRLHMSMQYLLQMFPSAGSILETLLGQKFPFPDESLRVHMAYINNLFRVKEYAPDLCEEILDLILDRVVKIDSQMQVDLDDIDDDMTAAIMYALRGHRRETSQWEDEDEDDSDLESVDSDDPDYDREAASIKAAKESIEKMDAILDILFAYFTPLIATNPSSDTAYDHFTTILREFEHMVLPTYKSRHTQFLVFHFAQMDERLLDAFCGQMIRAAFHRNTPSVLRQAAVAYLASFVARGAHVPRKSVREIFELLILHMDEFHDKFESSCRGPDLKRFHPFYSLAQAAMYIFCFRWQDLVESTSEVVDPEDPASYIGQDHDWIGTTRQQLSIHIFGKFNPLKVCAPVIVEEFAKLAHRLNFMYVYPLIEANKRLRLTQYMTTTYATGGALRDAGYESGDESYHQLDPYFPFDPYQLPVSKRWLEDDYVHWRAVPGLNEAEDDDDSDDMEDGGLGELDEGTATDSDWGDAD